ncbi:DNA replication complex GINS protein PSF1-like protein [Leptotrombidium deliense]|uniref:DNA replication complex GINS protein PSF1 n=1 Tax=Leptotrombidium deliense TaxID=299467 RepID=A0A443SIU6_9ACAR|nr:DNA replication complex GINS protein PSF1-like protein [Leptotrombidium deliense]
MFGEKASDLIKDLLRNTNQTINAYRGEDVQQILEEMNALFDANQRDVQRNRQEESDNADILSVIQVRHAALLWNKRCLISYHYERLMRLKHLRWEFGGLLPNDVRTNLSENEISWFNSYCNNLSNYMSTLNEGRGIDLTLHSKAPKRLYIQVRCLVDYGDFELDDGTTAMFSKDSTHYLPLSQCEKLIHQGILEQIIT